MATTVITGRDISLSFTGGTDIEAQATNAVLTKVNERQVYQTLDGEATKPQTSAELSNWICWLTGARQVLFARHYGQQQRLTQTQTLQSH